MQVDHIQPGPKSESPDDDGASGWDRRSIERRKPYFASLNTIQLSLLERLGRARKEKDARSQGILNRQIRLTVIGIASGLRATG